jgi:ribonuclease HII
VAVGVVGFSRDILQKIKDGELLFGIRDSKKLTEEKRVAFALEIKRIADYWRVVFVSHKFIDRFNINQAIFYGINRGIHQTQQSSPFLFVDGNYKIQIRKPYLGYFSLPKGDDLVPSISAASILAKTHRDHYMVQMDAKYPGYGFAKHKGYGTEMHRQQIKSLGVSKLHRLSFLKFLRQEVEESLYEPGKFI